MELEFFLRYEDWLIEAFNVEDLIEVYENAQTFALLVCLLPLQKFYKTVLNKFKTILKKQYDILRN